MTKLYRFTVTGLILMAFLLVIVFGGDGEECHDEE